MENSECTQGVGGLGSMMSEASAGGLKRGLESPASSFPQVSGGMLVVGWEPSWGCQLEQLCVASWLPHNMMAGSEGSVAREDAQGKLDHCA